jgi:hypothetical protein
MYLPRELTRCPETNIRRVISNLYVEGYSIIAIPAAGDAMVYTIANNESPYPITASPLDEIQPQSPSCSLESTIQMQRNNAQTSMHETGYYSPSGMCSSSSLNCFQLSACNSEYFTRSCAQSWFQRLMWNCVFWKKISSSRMHSLMKTPRACWVTINSLSCGAISTESQKCHRDY